MSSSGLIYAVIVGAWAAYLVPMWLRRQDELNEARPTERFSTAIRLLSGRAGMERRYAKGRTGGTGRTGGAGAAARADEPGPVDVRDLAEPVTKTAQEPPKPQPLPQPLPQPQQGAANGGRAKLLARRRRTTTVLFLAFSAGAVAAGVGGLANLWAPAVPGILLSLYIGHMRRQERHRFEFTMDQRRAAEAARHLRERQRTAAGPSSSGPARPKPSPRTADRRALVEQTDHAEWVDQQRDQGTSDDGWEPVPVPLPTYVTAPVAPRTHANLDLDAPDTWSSARSSTAAEPEPSRPPVARRPRDRERTPLFDQYAPGSGAAPRAADPSRPRAANE